MNDTIDVFIVVCYIEYINSEETNMRDDRDYAIDRLREVCDDMYTNTDVVIAVGIGGDFYQCFRTSAEAVAYVTSQQPHVWYYIYTYEPGYLCHIFGRTNVYRSYGTIDLIDAVGFTWQMPWINWKMQP